MSNSPLTFTSLLVPVDFSSASESAFMRALELASGEDATVILQHVIDTSLVDFAATHQWGTKQEINKRMRERAERELQRFKERSNGRTIVDVVISEGIPFLEILRKADDFAVDTIVIGRVGSRGSIEKLLFGSTAEKVLRGSHRPVIVLAHDGNGTLPSSNSR